MKGYWSMFRNLAYLTIADTDAEDESTPEALFIGFILDLRLEANFVWIMKPGSEKIYTFIKRYSRQEKGLLYGDW